MKPKQFPCAYCIHVAYMNNACAHDAFPHQRDLNYPAKPTSHFPIAAPQWCPLKPRALDKDSQGVV